MQSLVLQTLAFLHHLQVPLVVLYLLMLFHLCLTLDGFLYTVFLICVLLGHFSNIQVTLEVFVQNQQEYQKYSHQHL